MRIQAMAQIDLTYLESVAAGDKEFIRHMLEMFRESTAPEIEKIQSYYDKKDWNMVGLTAHKIKAPVQMLGQAELVDLILELEKTGRSLTDSSRVAELIGMVREKLVSLNKSVDHTIRSLS
jgi:HPt (histidine-containing phosphotransfer) domain-containing protein